MQVAEETVRTLREMEDVRVVTHQHHNHTVQHRNGFLHLLAKHVDGYLGRKRGRRSVIRVRHLKSGSVPKGVVCQVAVERICVHSAHRKRQQLIDGGMKTGALPVSKKLLSIRNHGNGAKQGVMDLFKRYSLQRPLDITLCPPLISASIERNGKP